VKIWIYSPRLGIKEIRVVLQRVCGRWVPARQRITLHFLQGSSHIQVVPGLIRHYKKPGDNGGTGKFTDFGLWRIQRNWRTGLLGVVIWELPGTSA